MTTSTPRKDPLVAIEPRRFRPKLNLGYHQALVALVTSISNRGLLEQVREIRSSIDAAEARRVDLTQRGADVDALQPTIYFLATLKLLRDLVQQGWGVDLDDDGVFMLPPVLSAAGADPSEAKTELRETFEFALADQLLSDSVTKFIARLERAGVGDLFASGAELADRLSNVTEQDVTSAVRPVLQLVENNARDETTGIKLQDIWRYARLQWSIPYQQTPGRNLHYLIRDAAAPNRPIIGIAALGNAVLGLSQRDEALGWSTESFRRRYEQSDETGRRQLARHLVAIIKREKAAIYAEDFEIANLDPEATLAFLSEVERDADDARRAELSDAGEDRTDEYTTIRVVQERAAAGTVMDSDWIEVATTNLYRRKRAVALADLVRAEIQFEKHSIIASKTGLSPLFDDDDGRRALDAALRRQKQRAIAESVMEIITCGAVAPYNQVLGGKLVSMLMTSPQVIDDFRTRYSNKVSLIASGMAGRPVVRDPRLAVLTTSSLYALGSAQYNRVRVPGSILKGGDGEVRFDRIGTTESFGTVQFASDTTHDLARVARLASQNQRRVNNLFGEGMSPKLRSLRMGLEALGLEPNSYLRHHSPRLLYAVPLARNYADVLLGLAEPAYVLPQSSPGNAANAIAQHWFDRWAAPRVLRTEVLDQVRMTSPDSHLLSRRASDLSATFQPQSPDESIARPTPSASSTGAISFVEKLHRNSNSYADRLTEEELNWIHVDLGLDEFVLSQAASGRQIVVTGNPGDGKTFVIERLRSQLVDQYGALVVTDANTSSDEQILSAWRSCAENNRAFVLAINEWPLFELERLAKTQGFAPVSEAIRQVRSAVYFGEPPETRQMNVSVIDLNLRNVLAPRVVDDALSRLTQSRFLDDLDSSDPVQNNAARLTTSRGRERLIALLGQAARLGEHTTMRQLMGYLAYLLTGGVDANTRIMSQGDGRYLYSTLAFDRTAGGPLFNLVSRAFDPAKVTHPTWDEALWRGTTDPTDWLDPGDVPAAAASGAPSEREDFFRAAKRRFYFEHVEGASLLDALPKDEAAFDNVLWDGLSGQADLVRRVVLALNRFYEPDVTTDGDRELKLWQSHRFDVRPPTTFVSLGAKRSDDLIARPPSFGEWVTAWLPTDLQSVGYFAVEPDESSGDRLLIDRDLFLTLEEASAGLGRSSWSRSVARKVTRFVDSLQRGMTPAKSIVDVELRNVDTNLRATVKVHRDGRRYEL